MRRLSFMTYCGLLVLAPVICAEANDTEWTKRKFENRSLPESILNQEDHFDGREQKTPRKPRNKYPNGNFVQTSTEEEDRRAPS